MITYPSIFNTINLTAENMKDTIFTVFVDGVEVTYEYMNYRDALSVVEQYIDDFKDVTLTTINNEYTETFERM